MRYFLIPVALGSAVGLCSAQTAPPPTPPVQAAPRAEGLTTIPLNAPSLKPQIKLPLVRSAASGKTSLSASPTLQQVDRDLVGRPLRLIDAVAVALSINPRLAQAGQNVEFYRGRLLEAKDAFIPTLGVAPAEQFVNHIFTEAYGLQATIPIDISHLLSTATRQAQFEQVGARLDVNRIRNEVVYTVDRSFFDVLRAQALVSVAESDLQDSLDRLRDAQVRYHAQAVAYIDVLRAQTDVANAQKQLIQSQGDVNRSLAALASAMGIDVNSKFDVTSAGSLVNPPGVPGPTQAPTQPNITSPNPKTLVPAPPPSSIIITPAPESAAVETDLFAKTSVLGPEYNQVLQEALQTRPEIWETDAEIAAAKAGVYLARRSDLPSFNVTLGYYDERSDTGGRYNQPQAFVGLTIPLYDAGVARDRVRQAQAQVQEQVTSRRQVVDSVTLDVQNAYFTLVQTRAQVAVANQALAQAQAAFELARIRYNTGVSTRPGVSPLIEVSDAQVALTTAEQNQVNALYDYNVARAQLDRGVGRFAFVLNDRQGYPSLPLPKTVGLKTTTP
jgi:outer membrane protein